jgi:hypothetical protein
MVILSSSVMPKGSPVSFVPSRRMEIRLWSREAFVVHAGASSVAGTLTAARIKPRSNNVAAMSLTYVIALVEAASVSPYAVSTHAQLFPSVGLLAEFGGRSPWVATHPPVGGNGNLYCSTARLLKVDRPCLFCDRPVRKLAASAMTSRAPASSLFGVSTSSNFTCTVYNDERDVSP